MKDKSIFYPADMAETIKRNTKAYNWAADAQRHILSEAEYWKRISDEELWGWMFGNTIKRSWMVWSSSYCPSCRGDVPMYSWVMFAVRHPWKTRCPHCNELFPKNDFLRFYRSGLDRDGIFRPESADRSLLFNEEHPDPLDPLHAFGVDDGDGYVEPATRNRWRFIGAYLIYGQWKQLIVGGIAKLANAYVVSGDSVYARKAGILLDRVADLYPTFDFAEQGVMYEGPGRAGYVSTWHDACQETNDLALAYDKIFDALKLDASFVEFLRKKSGEARLAGRKETFEDIQSNIEERIFRDAIRSRHKIHSNYPRTETAITIMQTVLDWPESKPEVTAALGELIARSTAVDGVTGEKGLTNYSAGTIQNLMDVLALYDRIDPDFLRTAVQTYPGLKQTQRFFIDTWCIEQYYPTVGDSGEFAKPIDSFMGARFSRNIDLEPSMYSFFWSLYRVTGDPDYVKVIYKSNGYSLQMLPRDLTAQDPEGIQQEIEKVIAQEGSKLRPGSVNKEDWCLAILRSGEEGRERALWIDYDSGFGHGHNDGMNIGLFAKQLDLMPDFGYPPVHYGEGWSDPKALWYKMTAAHNTIVVDGKNDKRQARGKTSLWVEGQKCKAIRVGCPELIEGQAFERTIALIDISENDSYIFDSFRVTGGKDHAKFMHSQFGVLSTEGLALEPAEDYGYDTLLRNFFGDRQAAAGWSADWEITDHYKLLGRPSDVHLKYTDLTDGAQAYKSEAWVNAGGFNEKIEQWIPCVMVRRQSETAPLSSTFVGIIEPYEGKSNISAIKRLQLQDETGNRTDDADVAVEVLLADGRQDLIVSVDSHDDMDRSGAGRNVHLSDWNLRLDGQFCIVSRNGHSIERIVLGNTRSLSIGRIHIQCKSQAEFVEVVLEDGHLAAVSDKSGNIELTIDGEEENR